MENKSLSSDRNLCCICIGNGAHNVEKVTYSDSQMAFQHYCSNIMGTFAFIIGIFGIVYAANIMENMITKEKVSLF